MKNKKGQLSGVQSFLIGLTGIALILIITLIVLGEFQKTSYVNGESLTAVASDATATEAIASFTSVPVTTVAIGADELYAAELTLMPTTSFSKNISASLIGGNLTTKSTTTWLMWDNVCNTTLVILNGTSTIAISNYSYVWVSKSAGTWAVNWTTDDYGKVALTYNCNKTFTAAKDDLQKVSTTVNTGMANADFLVQNTPAAYGDDKTLYVNDTSATAGGYINKTAWTLSYTKTTRTWTGGSTTASNTTGTVMEKLSTIPVWIGIIIVVAFAFFVLAYFMVKSEGGNIGNFEIR